MVFYILSLVFEVLEFEFVPGLGVVHVVAGVVGSALEGFGVVEVLYDEGVRVYGVGDDVLFVVIGADGVLVGDE